MSKCVLKLENLNKSFGITHANKDINLEFYAGEVRALAGENGCGKSTLLSQISGIYSSDSGTMYKDGELYQPTSPLVANEHKVAIVVQELGLIADLPAGVNVFCGKTGKFTKFGFVNLNAIYKECNAILEKWGLPRATFRRLAGAMNVEERKMIELARALSVDPDILILDEVTQALSIDNRNIIYMLLDKFREMGRTVILISHDLEEAIRISDTITIMRDGEIIKTVKSKETSEDEIKRAMVGRNLDGEYYRSDKEEIYDDEVVMSFQSVTTDTGLEDISFELHKGEILGFCGLSDSGIHDIGQVAYGLIPARKGRVMLETDNVEIRNAVTSLNHRMGYVPKDRDGEALMMDARILWNFLLPSIENIKGKMGRLDYNTMLNMANESKKEYDVKCTTVHQNMNGLSGGNKQKVNLGRWFMKDLQLLVIDCPTRGVDVGVKAYIYQCMKEAKKKGIAMILITDELVEAMGMADNIIVMKAGVIKKKISRSAPFNEEEIVEVMV